ncbi:MAG: hypothetical protein V4499_01370 [Pseudomonadota bacterium]|jgi:hypothetical protein
MKATVWLIVAGAVVVTGACEKSEGPKAIVGAWLIHDSKAPFPMHIYVFNADGTMQQANPDAGDAHGSDSDGKGIWVSDRDHYRGKWVEIMADRSTHHFTGRGEYSFEISVSGDRLNGNGTMNLFDPNDQPTGGGPTTFTGERVRL